MTSLPIPLLEGYTPRIKPGDSVSIGTLLATRPQKHEVIIDVASLFRIPRKKVGKTLKKHPGDPVKKGEILAEITRLFGVKADEIVSQIDGKVERFERDSGKVILVSFVNGSNGKQNEESIVSPIDGIVEVCNNDQILLTTDKDVMSAQLGIGGNAKGEIFLLADSLSGDKKVALHHLGASSIGKIVLGGIFDRDTMLKAIGMGAKGIIASSILGSDLQYIQKRHIPVPIFVVDEESLEKCIAWRGKRVYLQGDLKTILLLHL